MVNLIDQLPQFYQNSPEMVAIQSYLQILVAELWRNRDDFAAQLCIDTATWGLATWEGALGLTTDATRELAYRRERVKAKLRGAGTTTKALIQRVAETFTNGAVDVIEYASEYRVVIKFTGTLGIPPNLDDLTASLRDIMPAHLQWEYEIRYNLWIDVAPLTWGELAERTWHGVKEEPIT